jgi:hypothetical protein
MRREDEWASGFLEADILDLGTSWRLAVSFKLPSLHSKDYILRAPIKKEVEWVQSPMWTTWRPDIFFFLHFTELELKTVRSSSLPLIAIRTAASLHC